MSRASSPHQLKFLRAHVCLDSPQNTMASSSALVGFYWEGGARPSKHAGGFGSSWPNRVVTAKMKHVAPGRAQGIAGDQRKYDGSKMAKTDSGEERRRRNAGSGRPGDSKLTGQIKLSETRLGLRCNEAFSCGWLRSALGSRLARALALVSLSYSIS